MNILIFKTNLHRQRDRDRIGKLLSDVKNIHKCNIDKHDADKILRIESTTNDPSTIIKYVTQAGFYCEELPD